MKSAKYVFKTSETGPNFSPNLYLEPQDDQAASNPYMISLRLRPGMTVKESDALAKTLNSSVTEVGFQSK